MTSGIGEKAARGALLTLLGGMPMHLLSFGLTLLCARLLVPEAFGAYSLALAIYGFSDLLTNPTVLTYLVRNPSCTHHAIDVAWTASAIRGLLLLAGFWLLAPVLARTFGGDHQVVLLLRVLSLGFVANGLRNLHVARLHHELRFGSITLMESGGSAAGSLVAITLLAYSRNPIALVIGQVAGEALHTAATWVVARRRPRLAFDHRELLIMWRFSRWLVINGLVIYALLNLDDLLVAKLAGTAALGIYAMSYRIVNASVLFVIRPLGGVLLPTLARLLQDKEQFTRATLSAVSIFSSISWCLCSAGWVLAPDLFAVIGDATDWQAAAPVFQALLPFVLVRAINQSMGAMILAAGRPGVLTAVSGVQLALMIPLSLLGFNMWGLNGLIAAIVALSVGAMLGLLLLAPSFVSVGRWQLLGILVAPAPAAFLGAAAAHVVSLGIGGAAARLAVGTVAAVLTFAVGWELSCRSRLGPLRNAPSSLQIAARALRRQSATPGT